MPETIQESFNLIEANSLPDGVATRIRARDIRPYNVSVRQDFLDNVRRLGVLEPVLLRASVQTSGAPYRIIDGRRRVAAMRIIDMEKPIRAIVYQGDMSQRQMASILLSANMHRTPNVINEFQAINELIETGATIPQIASSLGIPESVIVARLRVGHLDEGLRQLLAEGRLSASLAQRLGAESPQTQARITNEFFAAHPRDGSDRLTASIAYPEQAVDEQMTMPLVPSPSDLLTSMTEEQRAEFADAFFRVLQPDHLNNFFTTIPSQTRRDIFHRVFASTMIDTGWVDLAETSMSQATRLELAQRFILQYGAVQFVAAISERARNDLRHYFTAADRDEIDALNLALNNERRDRDSLQGQLDRTIAEATGLRNELRGIRHVADVTRQAAIAEGHDVVPETGRAYRETLHGPSDDPSERGETQRDTNILDIAAAQFDYPVVEESWPLVVEHLTEAADAMPLTPSDECDRFHVDIEQLRVRAIAMERAENANAGVVAGRVIPPPVAPQPAVENAARVRTPRIPTTLAEHAQLLSEQAEQINANTTRRPPRVPRAESEMRPLQSPRAGETSPTVASAARRTRARRTPDLLAEQAIPLDTGTIRRSAQQEILDATRRIDPSETPPETVAPDRPPRRRRNPNI